MEKHIIGENGIGYTLGADSKASFLVNSSGESMQASFPAVSFRFYPFGAKKAPAFSAAIFSSYVNQTLP